MKKELDIQGKRLRRLGLAVHRAYVENATFDFNIINKLTVEPKFKEAKKDNCGTIGCKMFLMPFLWKDWKFEKLSELSGRGAIIYKNDTVRDTRLHLMKFFGLTFDQLRILFFPDYPSDRQDFIVVNGHKIYQLDISATEKMVNENIQKFIKAKYKL